MLIDISRVIFSEAILSNLKRLLTCKEAAAYCGVSPNSFSKVCPVRPISLGVSSRLRRYDRARLDEWIDKECGVMPTPVDWLKRLDENA